MCRINRFWVAVLVGLLMTGGLSAADIKVEAVLVWGTNDEKPKDANLKALDKATAEKLSKVFKWKNYFEVNRKKATIPSRSSSKIAVSKECEVEITEMEGPKVAYRLIGKGNPVNKTVAALTKGESIVIAGEGVNETAWFVVITETE
jgi:hypothetical protein